PYDGTAARECQHQQIVGVGGMDAPLLMRGDEVENDLALSVRFSVDNGLDGARVDGRPVDAERLAEGAHPQMVLVELLAPGERTPGNPLVHVGIASVVADLFRF